MTKTIPTTLEVLAIILVAGVAGASVLFFSQGSEEKDESVDKDGILEVEYEAKGYTLNYNVPKPKVVPGHVSGYNRLTITGFKDYFGSPGDPIIPMYSVIIAIPKDKKLDSFDVKTGKETLLGKYVLEPSEEPIPPGKTPSGINPNPEIYDSEGPYPEKVYSEPQLQHKSGVPLLFFNIYPTSFYPMSKKVAFYETITVEISLKDHLWESEIVPSSADIGIIKALVINPKAVETYD